MARVSGKTLREKVRKRFDTESCKYFLIQRGRKRTLFLFLFTIGAPPSPCASDLPQMSLTALQQGREIFNGMLSREPSAKAV